ncbi:MAG: hypothetical protein HY321_12685, partial [Armatimonadetes bacterium]|nr:hypothetical protein [Armatimonadota bacterium]
VVLQVLREVLAEADAVDTREDEEGFRGATRLGRPVEKVQMREILRRARKRPGMDRKRKARAKQPGSSGGAAGAEVGGGEEGQTPAGAAAVAPRAEWQAAAPGGAATGGEAAGRRAPGESAAAAGGAGASPAQAGASGVDDGVRGWWISERMRERIEEGVRLLEEAKRSGREFISLTDPDAQMMSGGVDKQNRERHSFEVAVDEEAGLLVAGGRTQDPADNARLLPLLKAAKEHEPEGVKAITGDSGFFHAGTIGALVREGLDLCIPDSNTAGDLHRGLPIGTTRCWGIRAGCCVERKGWMLKGSCSRPPTRYARYIGRGRRAPRQRSGAAGG